MTYVLHLSATNNNSKETELLEQSNRLTNEMLLERQLRVADAARKALEEERGRFTIRLKIAAGKKEPNPLGGDDIEIYEEGKHEVKTYHFHKITASDWNLYLMKRGELNNETAKPVDQVDNTKIADLNARIYEYLAIKYLGIKHDDYIRAEWDDVRLAVDACNYITEWQSQDIAVEGNSVNVIPLSRRSTTNARQQIRQQLQQQEEEETRREVTAERTIEGSSSSSNNNSSSKKHYEYDDY